MKITNGIEHTQFVQLPHGIRKKAYGNLLVDFSVKRFCDAFTWNKTGQNWKIGNPKICGWREEDLNAYLPKDILKEDIIGIQAGNWKKSPASDYMPKGQATNFVSSLLNDF